MTDTADATWTTTNMTITHAVTYADRQVRDWRWLWLRKRTITELVTYIEIDPA
jgi:hypothetical protein